MVTFEAPVLAAMGLIGFALVTAVLHTLARAVSEEQRIADLRYRVLELRRNYAKRLAELAGREVLEVSPESERLPLPQPAASDPAIKKAA